MVSLETFVFIIQITSSADTHAILLIRYVPPGIPSPEFPENSGDLSPKKVTVTFMYWRHMTYR